MSEPQFDQFQGTKTYIASEELRHAVNVAVALGRPLLLRGEPGTGKTLLAENLAQALGLSLIRWHVKSTTKGDSGPSSAGCGTTRDAARCRPRWSRPTARTRGWRRTRPRAPSIATRRAGSRRAPTRAGRRTPAAISPSACSTCGCA